MTVDIYSARPSQEVHDAYFCENSVVGIFYMNEIRYTLTLEDIKIEPEQHAMTYMYHVVNVGQSLRPFVNNAKGIYCVCSNILLQSFFFKIIIVLKPTVQRHNDSWNWLSSMTHAMSGVFDEMSGVDDVLSSSPACTNYKLVHTTIMQVCNNYSVI